MDKYWKSALMATLELVPHVDRAFVPEPFFPYSDKFLPLEFSLVSGNGPVGFCVQKDMMYRLTESVLGAVRSPYQIIYSNAVFIVGTTVPVTFPAYAQNTKQRFAEFVKLRELVRDGVMGKNSTHYWKISNANGRRKVLVVGATNMGNIGDDLLAEAIGMMVERVCGDCAVHYANFEVSRSDVSDFDLLVVGGGGIIYSSQFGANDSQNLANYLKLPIWADEVGVPCVLLGVGVQGRPRHIAMDPVARTFATRSLSVAKAIAVRDSASRNELSELAPVSVSLLPDLVFSLNAGERMIGQEHQHRCRGRMAFIGQVFSENLQFFRNSLLSDPSGFISAIGADKVYFAIMSNDDVPHAQRFEGLMNSVGVTCEIKDLRTESFDGVFGFFAELSGVVTTRFHGLVMAAMSGTPVLSIDLSSGKHSLLVRDFLPSLKKCVIDETFDRARIMEAIANLAAFPSKHICSTADLSAVYARVVEYENILSAHLKCAENGIPR